MRKAARLAIGVALAAAVAAFASAANGAFRAAPKQTADRAMNVPAPPASEPATSQPAPAQTPQPGLQTVVLDPAHGGTDEGAHGASGIDEKDVVLALAQVVQSQLKNAGWNVVMTRTGDQTLSFEQRAAIANAQPHAVFISLHVGSSGVVGSAYVYYYDFGQIIENQAETSVRGLVDWDRGQSDWEPLSRRLAQLLQVELAARFRGSPELPMGAPVFQLREIADPAIAVEIENVNAPNAADLEALGTPLAQAISSALQAFRVVYQTKAH